jgi:ornithine carbamoyltransferase
MSSKALSATGPVLRCISKNQFRAYSSRASPITSPFAPRHLLSISDLTPAELTTLVRNALSGKTVAMMFNKRSTRTRVSTEAAVTTMGGHAMFLGKDDIQLGVRLSRSMCFQKLTHTG